MTFYQKLLRERNRRKFQLKYIANIDQTSLLFVLDTCSTSNDNASAVETWVPDAKTNGNELFNLLFLMMDFVY